MAAVIETEGLTKQWGDLVAASDLALTVETGESLPSYARRVRRRDLALDGRRRGSRSRLLIAVVVIVVIMIWLVLQTLGGSST